MCVERCEWQPCDYCSTEHSRYYHMVSMSGLPMGRRAVPYVCGEMRVEPCDYCSTEHSQSYYMVSMSGLLMGWRAVPYVYGEM